MPATPKPDEFGRYRVETDTGAKLTVNRPPIKGETWLSDEPASDANGDAFATEYPKTAATKSGQSADTKEN